jgi:hypothetical protein
MTASADGAKRSSGTESGSGAVKTSWHDEQRNRSRSKARAVIEACPSRRRRIAGSLISNTRPSHIGQRSPGRSCGCGMLTRSAPAKAEAGSRPWPRGGSFDGLVEESGSGTAACV